MRIGSLCSGYGGLEEGVRAVIGGEPAWVSDIDPGACKILAHRYPDVPNLGDMTTVDWAAVEPVDVIVGGTPCQDVSAAGKRAGMRAGTRSGLWASMCDAIDIIRPGLVVWENVRGVLSASADSSVESCPICVGDERESYLRALGRVLGDLADIGYDASWQGLRAADVGAPHGRFRVFVVAWPATDATRLPWGGEHGERLPAGRQGEGRSTPPHPNSLGLERGGRARHGRPGSADGAVPAPHPSGDGRHEGWTEPARLVGGSDVALGGDVAADADSGRFGGDGVRDVLGGTDAGRRSAPTTGRGGDAVEGEVSGDHQESRPGKVLRGMRSPHGAEPLQHGAPGDPDSLLEPTELLAELWEQADRGSQGHAPLAGQASSQGGVRNLLDDTRSARPSRRSGSNEQRPVESADPLLVVSSQAALAGGPTEADGSGTAWGPYAAAIHRWEQLTRSAPAPTELGAKGNARLSPRFVEWLMGLPAGWVTDVPGLTRNEMLKALGNGVVPQQAAAALRLLLSTERSAAA